MPKITKQFVDKKASLPASGQVIYWCSELPGFGLRVTANGAKTYVAQARVQRKTVRVTIGRHGIFTAEQARIEAKKKLGELAKGNNLDAEKAVMKAQSITLTQVFDDYKSARRLRARSVAIYNDVIKRSLADWQDIAITKLTREMVEQRLTKIATTGNAQAGQCYRLLRALIRFAIEQYDVDGKPIIVADPTRNLAKQRPWTKNVRRQSVIQKHQLAPWFKEVLLLKETPMQKTMRDYFIFCLLTGLRRQEAAQLKWSNVDFQGNYLKIESEDTKNHQEHRLPLSDYLQDMLSRRLKETELESAYIFPGAKKGAHIVEVKRAMAKVTKESKVKFMLHDLRRTFITVAEAVDVPYYTLKRLVNHKVSGDVTSGYIVTDVERMREPMQKIANYILEQAGIEKAANLRQAQ